MSLVAEAQRLAATADDLEADLFIGANAAAIVVIDGEPDIVETEHVESVIQH